MNDIPIAFIMKTERLDGDVWQYTVACPYCNGTHKHGGGSGAKPGLLGSRGAHCDSRMLVNEANRGKDYMIAFPPKRRSHA